MKLLRMTERTLNIQQVYSLLDSCEMEEGEETGEIITAGSDEEFEDIDGKNEETNTYRNQSFFILTFR